MGNLQDTVALKCGVNAATKRTQEVIETKGMRFLIRSFNVQALSFLHGSFAAFSSEFEPGSVKAAAMGDACG